MHRLGGAWGCARARVSWWCPLFLLTQPVSPLSDPWYACLFCYPAPCPVLSCSNATAWHCIYGQYALPFLFSATEASPNNKTIIVVHAFLHDSFQLSGDWAASPNISQVTPSQLQFAETFRNLTNTSVWECGWMAVPFSHLVAYFLATRSVLVRLPLLCNQHAHACVHVPTNTLPRALCPPHPPPPPPPFSGTICRPAIHDAVLASPSTPGMLVLPACYQHCITGVAGWTTTRTNGFSLQDVVLSAMTRPLPLEFNASAPPIDNTDTCTSFNCNPTCPLQYRPAHTPSLAPTVATVATSSVATFAVTANVTDVPTNATVCMILVSCLNGTLVSAVGATRLNVSQCAPLSLVAQVNFYPTPGVVPCANAPSCPAAVLSCVVVCCVVVWCVVLYVPWLSDHEPLYPTPFPRSHTACPHPPPPAALSLSLPWLPLLCIIPALVVGVVGQVSLATRPLSLLPPRTG